MIRRLFIFLIILSWPLIITAKTIVLRSMDTKNLLRDGSVTFSLSARTRYRTFMLYHPSRFIVDLKDVKAYQKFHFSNYAGTSINDFRYATHKNGVFRMVFGLNSPIIPRAVVSPGDVHHAPQLKIIFPIANTIPSPKKTVVQKTSVQKIFFKKATDKIEKTPKIVMTDDENRGASHHDVIIVIDPGHGGKDPGATGIAGTKEKNVVLSISKILQRDINRQPGYHAMLTRTSDYYLTLRQRLAIARKDHADMFVAIHADKWKNTEAQGVSVFALSQKGATSEAARWLAKRENASELMGGVNLQDQSHLLQSVLINLSQSATIRASLLIGADVMHSIKPIAKLHHPRVEQAAFVVLKSPDIPSLLIETGFLSNPLEERRLNSAAFQHQLAAAIMEGISTYFSHYPPRKTWLSFWRTHPTSLKTKS